jgi:hypothetical protein
MTDFPADVAKILNDHTPGEPMPVGPSAATEAARSGRLTIEDVERLAAEAESEVAAVAAAPEEPQEEPFDWAAHEAAMKRHYPHAFNRGRA